jgi:cytochrome P450
MTWHPTRVVAADLEADARVAWAGERRILVIRVPDAIVAIEDRCSHAGCAFSEDGEVVGDRMVCDCHGSEFDLRSGAVLRPPGGTADRHIPGPRRRRPGGGGRVIDLSTVTVDELERDPYPTYARLRDVAPVAYMPCLDVWMIARWADVEAAATDPDRFPAHVERSPTDRALGGVSMMTTDGEPAKRRRRPFDPTLRPRAVEARLVDTFQRLCRERLDVMAGAGSGAELVADYFEPVSVRSLAHAIGIADHVDVPTLRRWFAGLAAGVSNYEDDAAKWAFCDAVSAEIDAVVCPLFERRLAEPADDLLSDLVRASEGDLEERLAFVMPSLKLVLLGGLQEPAHGGATIAHCLLGHPDQLAAVRNDPSLVPVAVDEGLRWTAPIGNLLRGIAPGTSLAGVDLPADGRAIIVVSSANRDRAVFGPTADVFDIGRPRRTHMSFAVGPHYCIGHHFARSLLATAIGMLLERFPRLRLDPDREVIYRGHEYRSPKALHVLVS